MSDSSYVWWDSLLILFFYTYFPPFNIIFQYYPSTETDHNITKIPRIYHLRESSVWSVCAEIDLNFLFRYCSARAWKFSRDDKVRIRTNGNSFSCDAHSGPSSLASAGPVNNERPIVRIAMYLRRYDRAVRIATSSPSTISGNCRQVKLVIKLLL